MEIMTNIGELISHYQRLQSRLREAIRNAPEGSIYYRSDAGRLSVPYHSCYQKSGRKLKRIDPDDRELITALQRKRFAKRILPKVTAYLHGLKQLSCLEPVDLYKEAAALGPQYRDCADWASETIRLKTPAFEALKDRQNPYPFEKGYVDTDLGRFRSKGEALDAKILHESGIRFLYEPAIFLGGKVVYPDFAVDLYWKQMIGIIERDGMLDDPQYKARKLKDLDRWITYGYYPGINLLILSDHPRFGYDERRTGNLLRAFCLP